MAWEGGAGEHLCPNQGLSKVFLKEGTILEDEVEAEKGGMDGGNEKINIWDQWFSEVVSAVFNLVSQKNGEGILSIHNKVKRKG